MPQIEKLPLHLSPDIAVIGGGIVGTCVARELQASGKSVLLLERGKIGAGCSFANAGWVTPCFAMPLPQPGMLLKSFTWLLDSSSPLHIQPAADPALIRWLWCFLRAMNTRQMNRAIDALTEISKFSLRSYASLSDPSLRFEKRGLLMVSATADGVRGARREMALMAERGIPGSFLEREELLEFEPSLKPLVHGGVYFPEEAQLEPYGATRVLHDEFLRSGGQSLEEAEVYDLVLGSSGPRRITELVTTRGRYRPRLVVLAAGSWSPEVARKLGIRIPLLGGKGYSLSLRGVAAAPRRPVMIVDRKIAVTPYADRVRIAGTLELVNQDFSVSPSRLNAIIRGAHEYLKLETPESREPEPSDIWRGLRPCTPDGVPMIGFSGRISNLFYCTGHQMLGLQSAPGSARLARELIDGLPAFTDPAVFSPARYE